MIRASLNPAISPRERAHQQLARQAAREGFVLLKNENNTLPLMSKKLALYGTGARKTLKGGTGSGEVNERYSITIEQGLEQAGYEITTKRWIDGFEADYDNAYVQWREYIARETAGMSQFEVLRQARGNPFEVPVQRQVDQQDVDESATDTAIYVISRQAGESFDRKVEKGDWFLTDAEYANLSYIAQHYAKTVLIINGGAPMDMTFLDEIPGIGAVVFYTQAGMEGGNALADVLSGYENFSGKLTDTWAYRYEDYPSYELFSHMDGDVDREVYREGIYVGYRHFDAYGIRPRYPFGYGLSYTDFDVSFRQITLDKTVLNVTVQVTNTGSTYAGKEVVQLYLSCPQGKLHKEVKRLVAFGKTQLLAPGQSQLLQLRYDMSLAGSYQEETSRWILEPGDYLVHVGRSALDYTTVAAVELDREVILEQCIACCAPEKAIEECVAPQKILPIAQDAPRLQLNANSFTTVTHSYETPQVEESAKIKALLDNLSVEEMALLLRGGGARNVDRKAANQHTVLGAGGKTTGALVEKGIRNIVLSDGPAGLNICSEIAIREGGMELPIKIPDRWNVGGFGDAMKKMFGSGGTPAYRYATAWPVHILLAQSWNMELLEQVGSAVGTEMLEFGVTVWLAPGMNIHRNPLCGRTFEYFSEDPILSGWAAAAITRGVQSHKGVGVSLKHFACNSQEANRSHGSSEINERALREIYLKGFEIAVKDTDPMTVMSSYNKINGVFNGNNHDLLVKILRCEWGFRGLVMTDWGSQCDPGICAACGNDLYMPGDSEEDKKILQALEEGRITLADIRRSAARVMKLIAESDIYAAEFAE